MTGKHIELFLVDGVSGGITTVTVSGWTGSVLSGPRSQLAEILKRPETHGNGTYLLLGDDKAAVGDTQCYIGKTENFADRFRQHDAKKGFWDRLVVITSKDDSFNEGHWGYLESRLVEMATAAGRATLKNTQVPQTRKLSEAQMSDMEAFIDQLQVVLPVLGVNVIRSVKQVPVSGLVGTPESPLFTLSVPGRGVEAHARVDGDEFVMLEGSIVVPEWKEYTGNAASTRRAYDSYKAQFDSLVADGSIMVDGDHGRLARNIPFPSPSTAGAMAVGHSCNGRTAWMWEGGTYDAWESRGL